MPPPLPSDPDRKESFRAAITHAIGELCGPLPLDVVESVFDQVVLVDLSVGATLYRQGEPGDCLHVVLTGRLLVSVRDGETERVVARPQPGDVVGEIAVIAGNVRAATVVAQRHCTLAMVGRDAIDSVVQQRPAVATHLARMVVDRLTNRRGHIQARTGPRTFLVLGTGIPRADVGALRRAVEAGLRPLGSAAWLDLARARAEGVSDFGRWFDACERAFDFVFLDAGPVAAGAADPWADSCFGHADRVLLVAVADAAPAPGPAELWLSERLDIANPHAVPTDLLLLQAPGQLPRLTRAWTEHRALSRHLHLWPADPRSCARTGRALAGRSVSLVLAGGGARGFAHLGVLRAIEALGIPVDATGGSSFGALTATGPARGMTVRELYHEQHTAFSKENPLGDYTFPAVSLVAGRHLERLLQKYMPMDIEDLPLPFFAVSSDLTANRPHVHDQGPAWAAIRASVSLPGILPPVLRDGNLLVDGAILNNFPCDVMRQRQAGLVIGVDLAEEREFRHDEVALPSGLDYLRGILPWGRPVQAPQIVSILMRGLTLAGRRPAADKARGVDLLLSPPMDRYGLLDWAKLVEIEELGYAYSRPLLESWLEAHPELR